jgi:large subunit ribosomal protein L13
MGPLGTLSRIVVKPMSTTIAQPADAEHDWYVIDAAGQTLGRLSTRIAKVLRGKHKPIFTPHVDTGDYVVVVNAEKVKLTGRKLDQKFYHTYSGYPGGLKSTSAREVLATHPERLIQSAVKGMLPKNRLNRQIFKKLKVYAGAEHPHIGQQPKPFPAFV